VQFLFDNFVLRRCGQLKKELTMKGIVAIIIVAAFFAFPATAQDTNKGRSASAPGKTGLTPGQEQKQPGEAKDFAPGRQKQAEPGGAKDLAPGSAQRKKN
jgi:hypothetical protein